MSSVSYELTKFAIWLLSPLTLALAGGLLAMALVGRGRRRMGFAVGVLSLAGLWLLSSPQVAWALATPLERRHPPLPAQAVPAADAVLLLGGAMRAAAPPEQPHLAFGSAADRVWHAASLYKAGKARWVLLSGGNQPGYEGLAPEVDAMAEVLRALGVPPSAIRQERMSRNTRENAALSRNLVRETGAKRILLVTSALHMPRALATFKAAFAGSGVVLIPAATDAEALGSQPEGWAGWLPAAGALEWSTRALKEYMGLAQLWARQTAFREGD